MRNVSWSGGGSLRNVVLGGDEERFQGQETRHSGEGRGWLGNFTSSDEIEGEGREVAGCYS